MEFTLLGAVTKVNDGEGLRVGEGDREVVTVTVSVGVLLPVGVGVRVMLVVGVGVTTALAEGTSRASAKHRRRRRSPRVAGRDFGRGGATKAVEAVAEGCRAAAGIQSGDS